jgi:hypothetical protein
VRQRLRDQTDTVDYDWEPRAVLLYGPANSSNIERSRLLARHTGRICHILVPKNPALRLHNANESVELLSPLPETANGLIRGMNARLPAGCAIVPDGLFAPTVLAPIRLAEKANHEKAVGSVGRSDVVGRRHWLPLL